MRTWPPPNGSPVGTWGWYQASDGRWYRTELAPAPGYVLDAGGRWVAGTDAAWQRSRWGLGDAWWGALVYVVASIALGLGVLAVVAATGGDLDAFELGPYAVAALVVGNVAAFFGVPWLATRRKGLRSLREDFGLAFEPVDLAIGAGFGIGGMIAAAIVGTVLDAAFGVDERTSNVPVDTLDGPGELVVFALAVAVVTPVVEELFFRGLVYRSLLKHGLRSAPAIAVATLVFVLPHLTAAESVASLVSLAGSIAVLGLAFQLACHLTHRLGASIVAHVVVNGVAILALALG